MRNYQLKKNNSYHLDRSLFMRMTYLVKDYQRMKSYVNEVMNSLPSSGKLSSDGQHSDPTICKFLKIERMSEECKTIEWALEQIPSEYQKIVFNKICYDKPYPLYADASTYSRWKCRFLYNIAEKLMYI